MSENKKSETEQVRILLNHSLSDVDFGMELFKRLVPLVQWEARARVTIQDTSNLNVDLTRYDLVIPLLSSDYFASKPLLEFSEKACTEMDGGRLIVQPVIIRNCDWKKYHFEKLIPIPGTGVVGSASNDDGWTRVMGELVPIIEKIERKGQPDVSDHRASDNWGYIRTTSDAPNPPNLLHVVSASTNSQAPDLEGNADAVTQSVAVPQSNPTPNSTTSPAPSPQLRVLVSAIPGDQPFVTKFQEQIKLLQEEERFILDVCDVGDSDQELLSKLENADIFIPLVCKEYFDDGRLKKLLKHACELIPSRQLDVAPIVVRHFHWKIGSFAGLKEMAREHVVSSPDNDAVWTIVANEIQGKLNAIANKRRATDNRPTWHAHLTDPNDPFDDAIAAKNPVRATDSPTIAENARVPNSPPAESAAPPDGAFMAPSNAITKPADRTRPCWFVGAAWGSGNDQTSRFIDQGIWENRNDHYLEQVKSILPGDRIAIKATHTRKKNVPFDHRDHWVSVMTIKAIGVVKENVGDGRTLKVEWTGLNNPRDWYLFTFIATVCRVLPGEWMSDALIAFAFEEKHQDITRFRNAPYWKQRFGDGPAEDKRFQWTKFYQAIADKLLDFKDDRSKLLAGIHPIVRRPDGSSYLDDQFKDDTTGPLKDICPFTAMGIFNRALKVTNRENIAAELAKFLGVTESAPTSFDGVPVLFFSTSWFFGYQKDRQDDDIDALWAIFAAAIRFADSDDTVSRDEFVAAYDNAIQRSCVGWNLTIGLYWLRPWEFPTLDSKSRDYITTIKLRMKIGGNSPKGYPSGNDYLAVLEQLEACFRDDACPVHSYPELSLAALQLEPDQVPSTSNNVIVDADGDGNLGGKPDGAATMVPITTPDVHHADPEVAEIGANEEKPQPSAPSNNAGIELWLSIHDGQAKLIEKSSEKESTETLLSGDLPSDWAAWEVDYYHEKKRFDDVLKKFEEWDEPFIKDLGNRLGKTIFGDDPQKILRDKLASLPGGAQLRLVLDLDAKAAMVPWEYIRWENVFLIGQDVSIVRHVKALSAARSLSLGSMPHVLFAWANPVQTEDFVRGESHLRQITTTFHKLGIRIHQMPQCDPTRLENELHPKNGFEAFHYVGHGQGERDGVAPVLLLHPNDSKGDSICRLDVQKLAPWLNNRPRRLVFLAACHSGEVRQHHAESSLALEIARRTGTPVVAMQFSVPRGFATEFSCKFYEHLKKTRNIEKSVYLARQVFDHGVHAFGIPVLYADMTAPDRLELPKRDEVQWRITIPRVARAAEVSAPTQHQTNQATAESPSTSTSLRVEDHAIDHVVQARSAPFPLPSIRAGQIEVSDDPHLHVDWTNMKGGAAKIRENYAFPESLILNAVGELNAGRHLLLIGPVGTGKTSLAREICKLLEVSPMETTASADWTVFDVVGGYFPHALQDKTNENAPNMQLAVRNGVFTEAVLKNWAEGQNFPDRSTWHRRSHREWLILDEMNRADMDRALGSVFTALESRRLRIPRAFEPGTTSTVEIPIPKDFRIIATMNAVDRHYLFRLSDALKRRFAFIEVPVTADFENEWNAIGSQCSELPHPDGETASTLRRFVYLVRLFYPLGTAQLLAACKFLAATSASHILPNERITQAIVGSVLPSLEDAPPKLLGLLENWAKGDAFETQLRELEAEGKRSGQMGGIRLTAAEFLKIVRKALPEAEVGESDAPAADPFHELARQLQRRSNEPLKELAHRLGDMRRMNESGRV